MSPEVMRLMPAGDAYDSVMSDSCAEKVLPARSH